MSLSYKPILCTFDTCTYCQSCFTICPRKAISFNFNNYGFAEPIIDEHKCIGCGLCEKSCPILTHIESAYKDPRILALYSKDQDNVQRSSSGGVFFELAKSFIEEGGCVFGVISCNGRFEYRCAENIEEVLPMRGSKYVQAEMMDSLSLVRKFLRIHRKVLFTGTPCQIASLRTFLGGKEYPDLLLTVDVVCHGIPTQSIFDRCMNINGIPKEKREFVSFRDTKTGSYLTRYVKREGLKGKWNFIFWRNDLYLRLFMRAAIFKPICYSCPFSKVPRFSDITIGDFWGIKNSANFKENRAGTSVMLLNTSIGRNVWEKVKNKFVYEERTLEEAIKENPNIVRPTIKPQDREALLEDLFKMDKSEFIKKYHLQLTLRNIVGFLLRRLKAIYAS